MVSSLLLFILWFSSALFSRYRSAIFSLQDIQTYKQPYTVSKFVRAEIRECYF